MDPYLCNGFTCVKFAMWPHAGFSVVKSPNARFTFHHMAKTRVANLFREPVIYVLAEFVR